MTTFVSAWAGIDDTAHVAVTASGAAADRVAENLASLVGDNVASRIASQDPTLWGPEAVSEASKRLGWTALHETTRAILPDLVEDAEAARTAGLARVVLCGMGGSSLGPEVVAKTDEVSLVVVDSTDPGQVRRALDGDLSSTIVVVSSKSGSTIETDSQRLAFEEAFAAAGLPLAEHMVAVTDPGSDLEKAATGRYRKVFLADPNVGGRFSVLSAFGVVPAAYAGVDVDGLLAEAAVVAPSLAEDSEANPALVLGAALLPADGSWGAIVVRDEGSGIVDFGDWAEQLVAESTGKDGKGILPVVATGDAPELGASGVVDVRLLPLDAEGGAGDISVAGTLGAQFLVWETATAVVSRLMGINPFDQPNVEAAKKAAREKLESSPAPEAPAFVDDGVEVRGSAEVVAGAETVEQAVASLLAQIGPRGYLAVMAYLDREEFGTLADVRDSLASRTLRPVTFGWGPRFLHSTGQLHKGGELVGAFLQITGRLSDDVPIPRPGQSYGFQTLIDAQASGDAAVLAALPRPVLRLHVADRAQLDAVRSALGS